MQPQNSTSEANLIQQWRQLAPVRWARNAWLSRLVTAVVKPRTPPVLLISLPRSGSSWTGRVLGSAPDALYLREPVSQSKLSIDDREGIIEFTPDRLPPMYQWATRMAFRGIPSFPGHVARIPIQWKLASRPFRRLVIKEVNPFAINWFVEQYGPRVIFLVRHPAAVILSWQRIGWISTSSEGVYKSAYLQGRAVKAVASYLKHYSNHRVVTYEDLCADTVTHFRSLYEFAGLRWTPAVEDLTRELSGKDDSENPYGTFRNSSDKARAWSREISSEELKIVRKGYLAAEPAWYVDDSDWQVAS